MTDDHRSLDPFKITILVCVVAVTLTIIAYLMVTTPLCEIWSSDSYIPWAGRCFAP